MKIVSVSPCIISRISWKFEKKELLKEPEMTTRYSRRRKSRNHAWSSCHEPVSSGIVLTFDVVKARIRNKITSGQGERERESSRNSCGIQKRKHFYKPVDFSQSIRPTVCPISSFHLRFPGGPRLKDSKHRLPIPLGKTFSCQRVGINTALPIPPVLITGKTSRSRKTENRPSANWPKLPRSWRQIVSSYVNVWIRLGSDRPKKRQLPTIYIFD